MFVYGHSLEDALKDAQAKGYAEKNPDADILGTDAARKTAILTALVSDKLLPMSRIHTEGITGIRGNDVKAASKIGAKIKLIGRCIIKDGEPMAMVAPFIVSGDKMLSKVKGVYNAVEIIGDPIGNLVFYGQGAGAGATASAVVADLVDIISTARNYAVPVFEKYEGKNLFDSFKSKHYVALKKKDYAALEKNFSGSELVTYEEEIAFVTKEMTDSELSERLSGVKPLSHIRLLD